MENSDSEETGVYVYAKRVKEITANLSLDEISKQYEEKSIAFEAEKQKLTSANIDPLAQNLNAKLFVLKEEVDFLKKVVNVVKDFK